MPASTAPAPTADVPTSSWASALARPGTAAARSGSGSAAAVTDALGSRPSSRRSSSTQAAAQLRAASRSPASMCERTSSSWKVSSNGFRATRRVAASAAPRGSRGGEPVERHLVEDGLGHPPHARALEPQPRVEGRRRRRVDALEQFAPEAGQVGGLGRHAVAQHANVDDGAGRQRQRQLTPAGDAVATEPAAQFGEVPAQRAERVGGVGEEELGESLA